MLTGSPRIGGEDRYQALHDFLVGRGWDLVEESGDPCWTYPAAFGGAPIALDARELDFPDLADFGPLRPTVYLGDSEIIVISHGTWNGCERHREAKQRFVHGDLGAAWRLGALIAEVEQASIDANQASFQECLLAGPCGDWFREWRDRGGPWPGARA